MVDVEYWIARTVVQKDSCVVGPDPVYAGKAVEIAYGQPAIAGYPDGLQLPMVQSVPGKRTPDALHNRMSFLLASDRLADLLRSELDSTVEYLRFELRDHRDRPVRGFGFIVNIVGTVDCVDAAQTRGRRSAMKPDLLMSINLLTLDLAKVPPDAKLFRIKDKPDVLIMRSDLKANLESAGMTGLSFFALGKPLPPMVI